MNVNEAALVEEGVDSVCNLTSYSEYRGEKIRTGAKIRLLTKELNGVTLGLKRILGSRGALYLDSGSLDLKGLLHSGGKLDNALDNESRTYVLVSDLVVICNLLTLENDLN
jgi:hypothetical protein